jgi:hypothetical protein
MSAPAGRSPCRNEIALIGQDERRHAAITLDKGALDGKLADVL